MLHFSAEFRQKVGMRQLTELRHDMSLG